MQGDSVQITISVPASLAEPGAGDRARVLLVLDAVRSERISWREGAQALGLAPSAFLDLARDHGVPVVRYDESDLAQDFETLDRIAPSR
jgi:predicted HTH domain antitoxin